MKVKLCLGPENGRGSKWARPSTLYDLFDLDGSPVGVPHLRMNLNTARSRVRVLQAVKFCRVRELLQRTRSIRNVRIRAGSVRACRTLGNVCGSTLLPDGFTVVASLKVAVAPDERVLGCFEETLEDLTPVPFLLNLLSQRVATGFELEAWFPDLPGLELDCVRDLRNEKIGVKIFPVPSPVICPSERGGVLSQDWGSGCKDQICFFDMSLYPLRDIPMIILCIFGFGEVALLDPSLLNPTYRDVFDDAVCIRETRPR